jgi:hypothetical protein
MMIHTTQVGYTVVSYTHVRTYVAVQNNYNGKVPDIAALQCIRYVPPSVGLHQMHTIVVPLGVSPLNHLHCKTNPTTF